MPEIHSMIEKYMRFYSFHSAAFSNFATERERERERAKTDKKKDEEKHMALIFVTNIYSNRLEFENIMKHNQIEWNI